MAKQEEIFIGLDVGSSKISVVVGKAEDDGTLTVIGVGNSHVTGVKKGVVTEIEETVSGISEAIEIAERTSGIPLGSACVNVNGGHITSINSKGVIAVGRADQEVTKGDLERVEDAAQAIQLPPNKEILHCIPRFYKIDDQEPVKDTSGLSGVRLELDAHLVLASTQATKNLNKCVNQAGIKVDDQIVSPLAAAKSVLKKKQRDLGCVLIDIGASTTGIVIFEEDAIYYTSVLPVGSSHITNDIAIGLRTSIDVAEKVKIKFGNAKPSDLLEREKIDLSEIDIKEEGVISQKYVAEIIEARLEEIFNKVKDELKKINQELSFPGGVVITGGGAKLEGIEDLAKEVFGLPAEIGKPHSLHGLTDKVYDPKLSVAVGLMLYSFEEGTNQTSRLSSTEIIGKVSNFFKSFLP